jgi:hypothetical protein
MAVAHADRMERLWQLRLSSRKRLPLFPTEASQRAAVRALAAATQGHLVLFSLLYEHGHIVVFCSEGRVGLLGRSIRWMLGRCASQVIEPLWRELIEGRNHLRSFLRYVLTQIDHHRVPAHPALWTGSCLLDLVGARWLPRLRLRLAEALPDLHLDQVLSPLGLPRLRPAGDELVRSLGTTRLREAACAALAVDSQLPGRSADVVTVRRLIVQVARKLGVPWPEVSRVLPVSEPTLFRLAGDPPVASHLERVVRTRLALEEAIQGRQEVCPVSP